MTERERAREFYWNDTDTRHAGLKTQDAETAIDLMATFAALRVREELEAVRMAVDDSIKQSLHAADNDEPCDGQTVVDVLEYIAAPIRKRISELAGSEEGSR